MLLTITGILPISTVSESGPEAILSLKTNGAKVALVVAGWEGADTKRAAEVLKNYVAYDEKLKGSEVKVTGTTASPTIVSSTAA